MKKLLVTAIGAAAALGAYAGVIGGSPLRFNEFNTGSVTTNELNATHGWTHWTDPTTVTNTYTIEKMGTGSFVQRQTRDVDPNVNPTNALSVKTTFGKPLSVNINADGSATNITENGIYFDSLVKFTVCEDTPDQEYEGAKIVMWLQEQYDENDNVTCTNLFVKAGYLSYENDAVVVSNAIYKCEDEIGGDFADKFHRVTIKAISSIVEGNTKVPGFAIYIDKSDSATTFQDPCTCNTATLDSTFTAAFTLNEAADWLNRIKKGLFPSMVQSGGEMTTLKAASFDGTGSITDIVFTDEPLAFAKNYAATKATVWNGDEGSDPDPYTTLEEALNFVNQQTSGTYTFKLAKGMDISAPLAFTSPANSSANVILDFAGFVITNASENAVISNSGRLVITNSVGNGGVYCETGTGKALVQAGTGWLKIGGGTFNGNIDLKDAMNVQVYGGSYKQDDTAFMYEIEGETGTWIVEGKTLQRNQTTGLYDVVDKVATFTVKFVYGLYQESTNTTADIASGTATPSAPAEASITGYTLTWSPALAATVTEDATYTAQYVAINYTISFVNEADSTKNTSVTKAYGTTIADNEVPAWTAADGYTGAWNTNPAGAAVSGDATYTWSQTGKTFTIVSYTNGVQYASVATQYAGEALTPASLTVDSATQTWDGKWYTTNGGATEFVFNPAGDLTQSAYATITPKGSTYPTYIDSTDSKITGQYEAWAQSYGADATSDHEAAFLLNVAPPAAGEDEPTLAADAVTISGTAVTITLSTHAGVNGYPYVKSATTLDGLKAATPVAAQVSAAGVITLTGESADAKFYQVGISAKPIK